MIEFIEHRADILLCTSIIESGLDISAANTIIIDRADMLGLSQLYQLRGRVGRSNMQAYAYLFFPVNRVLNEEAEKRLQAISENTELGSGFRIAMHDLEIRGAGNVLGPEQSGDIIAIGYELYTNLLEEAVANLTDQEKDVVFDTAVDIRYTGFIPDSYIEGDREKFEIYRKISSSRHLEQTGEIRREITDRYGPIPEEVEILFKISALRSHARKARIVSIIEKDQSITMVFSPVSRVNSEKIFSLIKKQPENYSIIPQNPDSFFLRNFPAGFNEKLLFIEKTIEYIGLSS